MDFFDLFCESALNINFQVPFDYVYEFDSCGLGVGCPFVEIYLKRSSILTTMAKKLINEKYRKIDFNSLPLSKFTFSVVINGWSLSGMHDAIKITWDRYKRLSNPEQNTTTLPDYYYILLTESDQERIYNSISKQIYNRMHITCDELLKIAEEKYYKQFETESEEQKKACN